MKLLRIARIKIVTSKGRIEKGETVVLTDEEYKKITYMTPDAFDVIDHNYVEPKVVEAVTPIPISEMPPRKVGRPRKVKVAQ